MAAGLQQTNSELVEWARKQQLVAIGPMPGWARMVVTTMFPMVERTNTFLVDLVEGHFRRHFTDAQIGLNAIAAQERALPLAVAPRWNVLGDLRDELQGLREEIRAMRAAPAVGHEPANDDHWPYDERGNGGYL